MFSSCATMFSENKYTYKIKSTPVDSNVTVMNSGVTIGNFKTPHDVEVHMKKDIVLKFEAKGYQEKYHNIETIKTFGNFTEKSNPSFLVIHNHEDALEVCKDFSQNVHNYSIHN
jgi:hypothetical protein